MNRHSVTAPLGYERPVDAFFQAAAERQAAPLVPGAEGVLVAVRDFIQPHIDLAGRDPSPPTPVRLRSQPSRSSPPLPAVNTSCRAAAGAAVAPAAARGRGAAESPADAQHAVEDAHALAPMV